MMFGIHVDDAEKAVLSTYEFCYHGVALKTCDKTNIKAIRNTCIQLRYELLFLIIYCSLDCILNTLLTYYKF